MSSLRCPQAASRDLLSIIRSKQHVTLLKLRTRIAVTFLVLLAAVFAASLSAVLTKKEDIVARVVEHQLDNGQNTFSQALKTNQRMLAQAAQVLAGDYGFREAVALRDTATLESALENSANRISANRISDNRTSDAANRHSKNDSAGKNGGVLVLLTSLDGEVMGSYGSLAKTGRAFPIAKLLRADSDASADHPVLVEADRAYQIVAVAVRSPLPIAWIVVGVELDTAELSGMTGFGVTLSAETQGVWRPIAWSAPANFAGRTDLMPRWIPLSSITPDTSVAATLSLALAETREPFQSLINLLFVIAGISLVGSAYAAFWLARNITRPLQNLAAAVDQIRAGVYDAPVHVERNDELGALAEGLQVMQAEVQKRDNDIRRLAYQDTLTGLMNRAAYAAALEQVLSRTDEPIAVAVINLHRFRRINEHLGFAVGNAVLREIAVRLSAEPNAPGAVARLAADQFAAFARLRDGTTAQQWGAELLARMADPIVVEAQPIDTSATIGIALAPADAATADELLSCADLALERARRDKRPLALYQPGLKPAMLDQLSLLGELRQAIEQDELRLFFQPKIELSTNRVAGAEVLLRWQHPTRGLLGPAAFIPFAEQTGFIGRITQWTVDQAVRQAAEWHLAGKSLSLAVNVSADDLGDIRFDFRVASTLLRHNLPPNLLTLELTESGFIEDPERALQILEMLATLGVTLSIDDFGTGYSSLSHLARMPVHEVKIDKSFIHGMEADAEFASVVRSAIDMGHSLGLKVVAEGIETMLAAESLRVMGCDIGQGYLYAKPMTCADLEQWLRDKVCVPVIAVPNQLALAAATDRAPVVAS
jgi:diguanylate cyclase (GGDEF)-like protein